MKESIKNQLEALLAQPAIDFTQRKYKRLLENLQANILKHHRKSLSEFHFLRFKTVHKAFVFLAEIADHITTAMQQLEGRKDRGSKDAILSVYLTYEGYRFLGFQGGFIPKELLNRQRLKHRFQFPNQSKSNQFENNFHIIISCHFNGPLAEETPLVAPSSEGKLWDKLGERLGRDRDEFQDYFKETYMQRGVTKNPLYRRYAFVEGSGNPRFFPGAFSSKGKPEKVLYEKDFPPLNVALTSDLLGRRAFSCGSYGVFLKFEIDQKAIKQLVETIKGTGIVHNESEALAHIIGRFRDGTPLTLSKRAAKYPTNDFDYKEMIKLDDAFFAQSDRSGVRCPFHAHIRKANPRNEEDSRKIVRRGVFYREKSSQRGRVKRGLVFLSFQRSIEQQFEYILNTWMMKKHMLGVETETSDYNSRGFLKTGRDLLFSQAGDQYEMPAYWNHHPDRKRKAKKFTVEKPIIKCDGGIVFFAPSISFFKQLKKRAKAEKLLAGPIRPGDEKSATHPGIITAPFITGAVFRVKKVEISPDPHDEAPFIVGTTFKVRSVGA